MSLLVVLRVHEIVVVSIVVEKLHGNFVHHHAINLTGGTEAVLEHGARAQVPQLGLDKGAQVAGRTMLDRKNGMQLIVVLDDHARTHLCGGDRPKKTPYSLWFWDFTDAGAQGQSRNLVSNRRL